MNIEHFEQLVRRTLLQDLADIAGLLTITVSGSPGRWDVDVVGTGGRSVRESARPHLDQPEAVAFAEMLVRKVRNHLG